MRVERSEYVEEFVETGADEVMCLVQMGTVPHEACMETIRQCGTPRGDTEYDEGQPAFPLVVSSNSVRGVLDGSRRSTYHSYN